MRAVSAVTARGGLIARALQVISSHRQAARIAACALLIGSLAAAGGPKATAMQASDDASRQGATTTELADGRVLIAGGDAQGSAAIYDPATGQTTPLAARLNTPRAYHGAVLLADGNVLILGGYAAETQSIEASAEIFLVVDGAFTKTLGPPKSPRVQPTLTRRADGVVVVSGGADSGAVEFYDPATQTFGPDPAAASVVTDREDYAPGETVTFIGRRWAAGETVRITLHEQQALHSDRELFATANDAGEFVNAEFACEAHHLGVAFEVTATGMTSGRLASWTFTDGAPAATSYTITEGNGSIFTGGSPINVIAPCDDCTGHITLPFPVTLYDAIYTGANVSSNGNIQFSSDSNAFGNQALPTNTFGATILPYWDDLHTGPLGNGVFAQTTGSSPNRVFHLWWHVRHLPSGTPADFELLIYENLAQFDVVYAGGGAGTATIGIQKSGSGAFTMYSSSASIATLAGKKLSFVGNGAGTTTSVTSSINPSVVGQSSTVTATVTAAGSPVTSGTVTFTEGARILGGPNTLDASGSATFSTSGLSVGTHVITATFNGNASQVSSSGTVTHAVNSAATTTTVSSNANPSVLGQSLTVRADVSVNAPGGGTASGSVQFQADGVSLGAPVTVFGGSATTTISMLSEGNHTLGAIYVGDGNFRSSSGALTQIVNRASSVTTVAASENSTVFGQPLTFTVMVAAVAPASGLPSGTVQFKDGAADMGPAVSLSGGTATFTTSSLSGGSHTITAVYAGDSGFVGSSGAVNHGVTKATPSVSAAGGTFVYDGQSHAATAMATGVWGEPLGPVTLTYGADDSQTAPTHAGTHAVTAAYAGNDNYAAASARATLTITPAPLTVKADDRTKVYGSANPPFTATIAGYVGGDSASSLAGTLSFATSATERSAVGSYAITPGGLTSSDYAIRFVDGTLAVTRASAVVTPHAASKTYGSQDPMLTGTLSGFVAADGVTASFTRTNGETVGAYSISAALSPVGVLANYDIAYATAGFTITPATLTVAIVDQAKLYGSPDPSLTYEVNGLRFNDAAAGVLTGALTRDAGESVGRYAIHRGTLSANANYILDVRDGTLTISYNTCLRYDPHRAVKSGATIPIKIEVCSADGVNVSSPAIVVHADQVMLVSTSTSASVIDAGDANPDNNFRLAGSGYIFNLKTTGLGTGTYHLRFTATNDPEPHVVPFQVR